MPPCTTTTTTTTTRVSHPTNTSQTDVTVTRPPLGPPSHPVLACSITAPDSIIDRRQP
ncbi:hypothetical protein K456DRAFT_57947 [Colletotrichum gloeosporioides 23]|nr:hypothetical protein K456DRAFT_57947 [Colletotrichum gloeosporioides 23]